MIGIRLSRLALCAGAMLIGGDLVRAEGSWLRLQQLDADQLSRLERRQQQDARGVAPLRGSRPWQLQHKFRQQKQYLRALQDRQRHEQAALGQRQGAAPEIDSRRQYRQLQRFRHEQEAYQQRLQMQRRSWPYRR